MDNKYVATILNRTFLAEDAYSFSFRNIILGDYDEMNQTFTDEYGNKYYDMLSDEALAFNIPHAAYNIEKIEDLKNATANKSKNQKTIIKEYLNKVIKKAYIVVRNDDYEPFIETINIDVIRRESNGKIMNAEEIDSILERLEKLILDTVDGKFSKEQLLTTKDNLEDLKEVIFNTIGTIELELGAIEENKSYIDYLNEQLEVKELVSTSTIITKQEQIREDIVKKYKIVTPKKETIVMKPKIERINIKDVHDKVTKSLIAQDEPVYRLITEIARKEMSSRKKREAILLVGKTGVGKSELIRLLKENMNRKVFMVDSTQITIPGYTGKDISEILWDLYVYCDKSIEKTENAIIYFDEIDKKGSKDNEDVGGKGVLNVLLPFIEGATYDACIDSKSASPIVKINTSNMTVILGGAFADVHRHLKKQNEIGFNTEKNSLDNPKYREAEIEDFVNYGQMPDEFMGRVSIVQLNDLGRNDLKRVLLESNRSAIKIQEEIFKKLGVKLTYTSEYIDKVVDKAYALKTGARGLNSIVDKSTWKAFAEVNDHQNEYSEVILNDQTVEDSASYQLIKKKNKK